MTERDAEAVILKKAEKIKEKVPPMYKILLLNDDFTPMEFVIEVLKIFFSMNQEQATQAFKTSAALALSSIASNKCSTVMNS